jgi:hypothetical protein
MFTRRRNLWHLSRSAPAFWAFLSTFRFGDAAIRRRTHTLACTENVGGPNVPPITLDAESNLPIFGRPVDITDSCVALGTIRDVILADWSRYVVSLRHGATIARDTSRYFNSDESAFKLILRTDGKPADEATTKLKDGTDTVSPLLVVETRESDGDAVSATADARAADADESCGPPCGRCRRPAPLGERRAARPVASRGATVSHADRLGRADRRQTRALIVALGADQILHSAAPRLLACLPSFPNSFYGRRGHAAPLTRAVVAVRW